MPSVAAFINIITRPVNVWRRRAACLSVAGGRSGGASVSLRCGRAAGAETLSMAPLRRQLPRSDDEARNALAAGTKPAMAGGASRAVFAPDAGRLLDQLTR